MSYCNSFLVSEKSVTQFYNEESLSELQRIEKHTVIFASMCPDEILDHYDDYNTREYYTTLMLGDISGFTELAEKYTTSGESGPSKLTETLNSYIGPMVQEILSHHGDVLKFSGDAFMVMWKLKDGMVMRDLATEALQTACIIQKYFGTYETDIGVTLKVKIAIASGKMYFTSVGDPEWMSHYIITGKPMWDAKNAEALCRGGDILVASSSWQWANPKDYVFKILPDGRHTLILAGSTIWESSKEAYGDKESTVDNFVDDITSLNARANGIHPMDVDTGIMEDQIRCNRFQSIDYTLRPKVITVAVKKLKNQLRSYMLRPVIHSVESDEHLEHLTEIRQVVIVFINVITENIGRKKLILLVNKAFKLICRIVNEMQGCVNKVSLFDKDLMFLCIFGLRGGKQELEAQIALRCASTIKNTLSIIKNINSVTIGVSTGMTYCGVVGHILRREYTVIGMPVNKAARLMVTYINKIVCDRESFLHSRLEAGHFILQESKHLKGISQIGPIYEFIAEARIQDSESLKYFPLLNRKAEILIFTEILDEAQKSWIEDKKTPLRKMDNILIIRGESRIGKTKLLNEMSLIIPEEVNCNYITLTYNDHQIPYNLINLILSIPLGLNTSLSSKNRQDILLDHLKSTNYPENLCLLNHVFNVNFKPNSHYSLLSRKSKKQLLHQFIAELVIKCINQLWIILIDDIENADLESLDLISAIIKQHRILFIVGLIDDEKDIYPVLQEKAKIIKLEGLDKWYHVGLACQFLMVDAISPELEKVIQKRSHGNPGWIGSFLVSLLQIGGIEIIKITKEQLSMTDLVAPSSLMILSKQLSKKESKTNENKRKDEWRMYENSYEDSDRLWLFDNKEEISICIICPDFEVEDITTELTTDVTFLKIFDSLKPLDQILLKCAAVLGETIDRNLLEKLLEKTPIRDIALSVAKIFEMQILGCAARNFDQKPSQIIFLKDIKAVGENAKIECGCTNVEMREPFMNLPKYALCQSLQFKFVKFRAATYRLLTEHQKIEYHKKALRYLQHKTTKCTPCGSGYFTNLIKRPYQDTPKSSRRFEDFNDLTKVSTLAVFYAQPSSQIELRNSSAKKWFHHVIRRSEPKSIPRTFSNINFTNCQCNSILIATYTQILNHCQGIDRNDKVLIVILEYVKVLLATSNIPQAKNLLETAEEILIHTYRSRDDELVIIPCLKSKIKTLQARCNLQLELINEAMINLEDAIKTMGYSIPKHTTIIRLKTKLFLQRQKLLLRRSSNFRQTVIDGETAEYNCQLSTCLSQIFKIFQIKGMHDHAELAAVWSLNAALVANNDFIALCNAYANMLIIFYNFKNQTILNWLENDSIKLCNGKEDDLSELDLRAILKLYSSLFYSYWMKADITEASKIGLLTLRVAQNIGSIQYQFTILSRLVFLLTAECRYKKIISLLKELEIVSKTSIHKSHRMLYHILCIEFKLDTGINVISIDKCEEYYQEEGKLIVKATDYDIKNRFFIAIWLWYLRIYNWEASTIWKIRRMNSNLPIQYSTDYASITAVKKLEGLLLYYVYQLDSRNYVAAQSIFLDIKQLFKIIEKMREITKIILPRYFLMKAYFHMICLQSKLSIKFIQQSKNVANSIDNKFMKKWVEHCEKTWMDNKNIPKNGIFNKYRKKSLINNIDDVDDEESATFYSLPLPKLNQIPK